MMKRKILIVSGFLFLTQPVFAMFCPGNYNQINIGDTMDQVIQQCGKPTRQKTVKSDDDIPQQWTYFVKSDPSNPASVQMTIAFAGGQVINITVQGTSLSTTQLCGGNSTSVGDKLEDVKTQCGSPTLVTKGQGEPTETTTFSYDTSQQTTQLVFVKGKLTERK